MTEATASLTDGEFFVVSGFGVLVGGVGRLRVAGMYSKMRKTPESLIGPRISVESAPIGELASQLYRKAFPPLGCSSIPLLGSSRPTRVGIVHGVHCSRAGCLDE